jgi:fructose-specific component phosphotransferase system IIB-like protein
MIDDVVIVVGSADLVDEDLLGKRTAIFDE